MLIKEYRICLPLTVDEYRIAQLYMIQKKSREESTGRDSGVEIIKNEPYDDGPGGKGQFTFKIYHVGNHLPAWLRGILPPSALRVEEEAWNAYPYTRTVYRVPFVDKLTLDIETYYFDDNGCQDDVFNLSKEEKDARLVDFIDIVQDIVPRTEYKSDEDPTLYVSHATGRGPLSPDWRDVYSRAQFLTHECHANRPTRTPDNRTAMNPLDPLPKRIMCAYKLCRVGFRYWGMQKRVEQFIHDSALRKTMVRAHRQVWTWQDEWYGLTIEEIRRLEQETAHALASKMVEVTPDFRRPPVISENGSDPIWFHMDESPHSSDRAHEPMSNCVPTSSSSLSAVQDDPEGKNVWWTLKTLETHGPDTSDYEPYNIDDDTASFVSCQSAMSVQSRHMSATISSMDGPNAFSETKGLISILASQTTTNNVQPSSFDKLVLILVVHGGCLVDAGDDLAMKRSDVDTLRKTMSEVIANHYPILRNRIAIELVPCFSGLSDTFHSLARLKTTPIDPKLPVEVQLTRDLMPLGCIPLFLATSANYPQMIRELASRLNACYIEFLHSPEGIGFKGSVCLVADSVGAILTYDLLNTLGSQTIATVNSHSAIGVSAVDAGARRWREPLSVFGSFPSGTTHQDAILDLDAHFQVPTTEIASSEFSSPIDPGFQLNFTVSTFFMLGSPVGLLLALRQRGRRRAAEHNESTPAVDPGLQIAAGQVYNLFHSTDPCGFRLEPLLHTQFEQIGPILIPQYVRYPLGDSQPTSLVATMVRNAKSFVSSKPTTAPDGNHTCCVTVPSTHNQELDSITLLALDELKIVRRHWWGQHRIDYNVHCPHGLRSILAPAWPPIFHASYWESRDVIAFILRQLLSALGLSLPETSYSVDMDDEVAVAGLANVSLSPVTSRRLRSNSMCNDSTCDSSTLNSPITGDHGHFAHRFRLKRQGSELVKNVKSNHRANDVIVLEGSPQVISARFIFGLLDLLSLSNEKITIQARSYGGQWVHLGTDITDSSGRIRFRVPDHRRFGIGLHPIMLTAESDPKHPIELTLAVVSPQTESVVFSIDGSFAASLSIMGKDPKVRPGAVDVARHWQGLGYILIYLSARPDMQQRRVTSWLANHNFPQGICLFVDGISADPLRQKGHLLKSICDQVQLHIHCAYGSGKDVHLYRSFNIPPQRIFTVGRISRGQAMHCVPITRGYAYHLMSLIGGHPASVQASKPVILPVPCPPFDLSTFRTSSVVPTHRSLSRASGSCKYPNISWTK